MQFRFKRMIRDNFLLELEELLEWCFITNVWPCFQTWLQKLRMRHRSKHAAQFCVGWADLTDLKVIAKTWLKNIHWCYSSWAIFLWIWTNCSHTWPTSLGYFCRDPRYSASTLCCWNGECSWGCINFPETRSHQCFWVLLFSLLPFKILMGKCFDVCECVCDPLKNKEVLGLSSE